MTAAPKVPAAHDAEDALIGAMFVTKGACRAAVESGVTGAEFHDQRRGLLFDVIAETWAEGVGIDPVTIAGRCNGLGYTAADLREYEAATPASANAPEYARAIRETARRRQLIGLGYELGEAAREGDDTAGIIARLSSPSFTAMSSTLEEVALAGALNGPGDDAMPTMLRRSDGRGVIYPGKANGIHSEPSLGKTWIAVAVVAETLASGGRALTLDWEDRAPTWIERLRALGVSDDVLADPTRLRYVNPTGPLGMAERSALAGIVADFHPDLVVFDAFAPALARDGIDENDNSRVTGWFELNVRPLTRAGATALILDHVIKNPIERTRGARGAGAKLALIDGAAFELRADRPFSREHAGSLRLVIAKDRPGRVGPIGTTAATIAVLPDDGRLTLAVHADETAIDDGGSFRPTALMTRVSGRLRALEGMDQHPSKTALVASTTGKKQWLMQAIDVLISEGYIAKEGSHLVTLKPYPDGDE